MFEILLIAAAGAAGFFIGRRTAPCPKDHTAMVAAMAFLTPQQRTAILSLPAVDVRVQAGPGAGETTLTPPIPLFTADEKRAILAEVAQWQKDHPAARYPQAVLVTQDELEFRETVSAPAPPRAMGIPVSYIFQ